MVLRKIKRLLGLGSDDSDGRSERDVTVQERSDADTQNEAAVKGTDEPGDTGDDEPAAAGTDADASTESMVDEEIAQEEPAGRAEPAEAAGPGAEDETTDIEETGAAVEEATEADDDSPPVDEIKGIGPAYSERLAEIEIHTVADLREADAADVAERTTVPEKTVRKWIDRANDAA